MAKTRIQKESLLESYVKILKDADGYIAVDAKGIDNASVTELKKQLKTIGSSLTVVKNTIFKLAVDEAKQPAEVSDFDGQTAIITYTEDPTEPAKLLKTLQEESERLEARFGVVEGDFFDGERIMQLAEIPSREELLAKMLGSMVSPISGFMNAVTGNVRGFVQVVKQLSEKESAA